MSDKLLYLNDNCRSNDNMRFDTRINSKIEFYNDSGELIWEPLHNKTVIAGAGLTLMKLFNLDRSVLENTPTYNDILGLSDSVPNTSYPSVVIKDTNGTVVGEMPDETQRTIIGFCVGMGGSGLEVSDVFNVPYASWITPDNLVPFKYPLSSSDSVDETIYKGKRNLSLENGQVRNAYYFKTFANTPALVQNYVSTIGTFTDSVSPENVYSSTLIADQAQSYIELHLKITKDDCRDFFITHKGLEEAKINQISLVSAWSNTHSMTKLDASGNTITKDIEVWQQIRPFSVCNFPTEILSSRDKSVNIIYTLYC